MMVEEYKKYQGLSEQLSNEIEIYESSYKDFEGLISFREKAEELTSDQNKVIREFIKFCNDEGMYDRTRITKTNFEELKKVIQERVELMKQKKAIVDKKKDALLTLNNLEKSSGLDKGAMKLLQDKADSKYDHGTEKNKEYLKTLVAKEHERLKKKAQNKFNEAKEEDKKLKKENNYGKVVSSAFGPFGNNLYNMYAKVHNANVKIRKHKLLNLIVKGGLVLLYGGLISALPFSAGLNVLGMVSFLVAAGITVKHSLPWAKIPSELPIKENKLGLKESLFRYRKARGKGAISANKKLYEGIKFETTDKKVEEIEKENEKSVEKEEVKEVTEEKHEEVKPTTEKERTAEIETTTGESKTEKTETTTEEEKNEKVEEIKEEVTKAKNKKATKKGSKEVLPEEDSSMTINSMDDVMSLLRKLQGQGGIETVSDYYSLKNVRLYLGNVISKTGDKNYIQLRDMFDELAKNMPADVRERVAIVNRYRDLDLKSKTTGKKISVASAEKQRAEETRKREFERIKYLIVNSKEDVMDEVNFFMDHYNITSEQGREIREMLAERLVHNNDYKKLRKLILNSSNEEVVQSETFRFLNSANSTEEERKEVRRLLNERKDNLEEKGGKGR